MTSNTNTMTDEPNVPCRRWEPQREDTYLAVGLTTIGAALGAAKRASFLPIAGGAAIGGGLWALTTHGGVMYGALTTPNGLVFMSSTVVAFWVHDAVKTKSTFKAVIACSQMFVAANHFVDYYLEIEK
ncbi:Aste57867_25007 [Aphanomyces stellatus]|uniref:Aste57867_25007 protein n=1 Tax=Aphanomyces stellatus TaxID=120398 RepID=A0A485LU37_9STRA|nr:hypothetical protein As57867_024929 [Aphanomyces stellatus]VFU01638.1 Aste57867_25007 [Aphanomyces stellatus]